MKAVVFKGTKQVVVEDRPIPTIQDPQDVIVKVGLSGLCGRYGILFLRKVPETPLKYVFLE